MMWLQICCTVDKKRKKKKKKKEKKLSKFEAQISNKIAFLLTKSNLTFKNIFKLVNDLTIKIIILLKLLKV